MDEPMDGWLVVDEYMDEDDGWMEDEWMVCVWMDKDVDG